MTTGMEPAPWGGAEIDDELEVRWAEGSSRASGRAWVVFTHTDGTPFVTDDEGVLRANPMPFLLESAVWPLVQGDVVTSVRKAAVRHLRPVVPSPEEERRAFLARLGLETCP